MEDVAAGWRQWAVALLEREVVRTGGDDGSGDAADPARRGGGDEGPVRHTVADEAAAAVARAERALEASLDRDGPLATVAAMAELEPTEIRVFAVCVAIELDRRLQRLVGLLRHDPLAGRPDVDLLVRLLGPDAAVALADDGALTRAALLEVDPHAPLAAAEITVPRRVAWSLLGDQSLDPGLPADSEVIDVPGVRIGGHGLVVASGADRVRRVQAAIGALAGTGYLLCSLPSDEAGWRVLVRQATVAALGVVLECDGPLPAVARRWIERADHLGFAVCTPEPLPAESLPRRSFVEVRAADRVIAESEWRAVFGDAPLPPRRPAASDLQLAARLHQPGEDPADAIRRVATGSLLKHARRVIPAVGWDDLVLPVEQQQTLRNLAARYRDRAVVHETWHLPLYPSPGVVALFAGPSGTGKSTAAEVIAGELGVDMFRVDLSALVSKYIGETEKNLEEIFSAAHSGDYLLLFDEADALFGARSKVSDARDRYANMEVSYLLQRLESYDGFVILTSNFQGNIDPAFLRRIHVAVHFAVPSEADRQRIWQRSLAGAPQQDLDLDAVARAYDLTGGSIRMAALSAAYLAADRGGPIGMDELLEAITAEMTKLRRRTGDGQFVTRPAGSDLAH